MRYSKLLIVPALIALSVPQMAQADNLVEFKFAASELATDQSRAALLERLTAESRRACRLTSSIAMWFSKSQCAEDIKVQLIEAIGNEALTQLAADTLPIYQSASR